MPKNINLSGSSGKTYNLDDLMDSANDSKRSNSDEELIVQIWQWCPDLPTTNPHHEPNPPKPEIGQMWLSKLVKKGSDEYLALLDQNNNSANTTSSTK